MTWNGTERRSRPRVCEACGGLEAVHEDGFIEKRLLCGRCREERGSMALHQDIVEFEREWDARKFRGKILVRQLECV